MTSVKVQWQLVDVETKQAIPVGAEFELVEDLRYLFDAGEQLDWEDACFLFGDPTCPDWGIVGTISLGAVREAARRV